MIRSHARTPLQSMVAEGRGRKRGESKFISIYKYKIMSTSKTFPRVHNQTKPQTDPPTRPHARTQTFPSRIHISNSQMCWPVMPPDIPLTPSFLLLVFRSLEFLLFFLDLLRFCIPFASYAKIIPTPTTTTTEAAEAAAAVHSIFTDYQLFVNPIF